jgi:hypothetical protein
MNISTYGIPLGIFSYIVMLFAVLTGIRLIRVSVKVHKTIALIGIISATVHFAIVIYLNYFYRGGQDKTHGIFNNNRSFVDRSCFRAPTIRD